MHVSNPAPLLLELRETYLEICEPEREFYGDVAYVGAQAVPS